MGLRQVGGNWQRHYSCCFVQPYAVNACLCAFALSLPYVRGVASQISPSNHTGKFVALRVADAAPFSAQRPSHCALILAPGIRLEMNALPDPQWLAALPRLRRPVICRPVLRIGRTNPSYIRAVARPPI